MTTIQIFLLIACVAGISIGQVLFKKASATLVHAYIWSAWVFNGWLWIAVLLYGSMTLLWIWLLRHIPLHTAYPFMGLAFLIVPTLAWALLGESMHWRTLAGGTLIMAGVALASTS